MSYVIVGTCIKDGACVDVCPVDCIHPGPGEADHDAADMLFIDPAVCVRCNA
jgi:ferredoxin